MKGHLPDSDSDDQAYNQPGQGRKPGGQTDQTQQDQNNGDGDDTDQDGEEEIVGNRCQ